VKEQYTWGIDEQHTSIIMSKHIKNLTILIACLVSLISCSKMIVTSERQDMGHNIYEVTNIKKVNDWYFIYLNKNDSVFKVVSKEPISFRVFSKYPIIKKNRQYNLTLHSYKDTAPIINDVKIFPQNYTGSFQLDSLTTVSLEPDNNIFDIYYSPDLAGLYYLK